MHLKPMGIPGKCPAHLRAWTEKEDELLISLFPLMTCAEIAIQIGRGLKAIEKRVGMHRQAGRLPYKYRHFTPEDDAFIKANRHVLSASDMAVHLGRKQDDIRHRASALGISLRKYGNFCHLTKYSDEDVELIRQLRDEFNLPFKEIAEKFETSRDYASQLYHKRLTANYAIVREYLPR